MKRSDFDLIMVPVIEAVGKHVAEREAAIVAKFEARLAKAQETIASLERRASRHADHLARVETRLKALEHVK